MAPPLLRRSFPLILTLSGLSAVLLLAGCAATLHHHTGMRAMDKGVYPEAVKELQLAAEMAPDDVRYQQDWLQNRETATNRLLFKAGAALAVKNDKQAEQHYRTILAYDKDNARALAGIETIRRVASAASDAALAREAFKRGDTAQASQLVSRALELAPKQAEALALRREIEALQAKEIINMPSLSNLYKKPINLEFRDASVKMVFEALSRTTGINFIFDREVKAEQRTTVFLRQTTLEDAIDVILTTNQLDKKILNPSSVLIYPNSSAKTKEYQDLMVKAFYLANVEAKQTANLLKTVLKLKDVFVDDKSNMIVLRENPDTIILAEKLIALHDMAEPEVMLEVEVLEISRARALNLGVQVPDQLTISPLSPLATTSSASSGSDSSATGASPTFKLNDLKHLNADTLGVTLPGVAVNLQKTDGDANLLANPRIRVRDREKAKIMIGDKVPIVTTTATPNGFLSENITYQDVGLKLEVEPEIHLHGEIGLKISLEVSSLVSSIKTSNGSQAYQIGTRNFNSALRLMDGETQVLGGLISDADRSSANRIPLLGDLPLLGRLFSNQKDEKQKTEIVLSITPHLIRNIERKEPAAESFWSGTDANLRSKPLLLRSAEGATTPSAIFAVSPGSLPPPSAALSFNPSSQTQAAPAAIAGDVTLSWKGPLKGKVGEVLTLELQLECTKALRAAPLQLAFNPIQFQVVSVKEGDFFSQGGKGNFSQVIDMASGRISVGATSNEAAGVKGKGRLLTVELKPLAAAAEAEISVVGIIPVGISQAIDRPASPIVYKMEIAN